MRMTCLIAATLAAAGCRSPVDDCEGSEETFILDRALDEQRVNELLATFDTATPGDLFCDDVCGDFLNAVPDDLTVDTCKLSITGELSGAPETIIGSVSCRGQIHFYCL